MAKLVVKFPTDEELEQSNRFRTYLNYLSAFDKYIQKRYNDPLKAITDIVTSKSFKSIQAGKCLDHSKLDRLLRNAWFTEIQMHLATPYKELIPYSNHWTPVQLYYSVFLATRAFFISAGLQVAPNHSSTLRAISGEIRSRPSLFPQPWRLLCEGDTASSPTYRNLPRGITINPVSSLSNGLSVSFWDSFAMFLRTTRDRQIVDLIAGWKRQQKRKRILALERTQLVAGLSDTSIFHALYRLRIRSNYADADSFLLSLEIQDDAKRFNDALHRVTWYTLMILELLTARHVGKNSYAQTIRSFEKYDIVKYSTKTVTARWKKISSLF